MNATTKKTVELWPDETSNGRLDSQWIVSIETEDSSTTKYTDYDYEVARELALNLGAELGVKVIACNRLGETCVLHDPESVNA